MLSINEKYKRYDDTKWTIPLTNPDITTPENAILLTYLKDELLPFPQSIVSKNDPNCPQLLMYAETIQPFFISMNASVPFSRADFFQLLGDITTQIQYYHRRGYAYVGFDAKDIVQIKFADGSPSKYAIFNDQYVYRLKPHNKKEIQIIYVKGTGPQFCSPELTQKIADHLFPITLHCNAGYYGFGKYVEFMLSFCPDNSRSPRQKLCGFLDRCFHPDEDERKLLYL